MLHPSSTYLIAGLCVIDWRGPAVLGKLLPFSSSIVGLALACCSGLALCRARWLVGCFISVRVHRPRAASLAITKYCSPAHPAFSDHAYKELPEAMLWFLVLHIAALVLGSLPAATLPALIAGASRDSLCDQGSRPRSGSIPSAFRFYSALPHTRQPCWRFLQRSLVFVVDAHRHRLADCQADAGSRRCVFRAQRILGMLVPALEAAPMASRLRICVPGVGLCASAADASRSSGIVLAKPPLEVWP